MIQQLSRWGTFLNTRELGREVREQLLSSIQHDVIVIVDFSGIELTSQSFADEVFGKLVIEIGLENITKKFRLANVSPDIGSVIKYVMHERWKETVSNK